MTVNAINGSAINEVRFPGAEQGLSLVEMVGTVEVTASISALRLRVTSTAVASGKATVSSPATTVRTQVSSDTVGAATGIAAPLSKVSLFPSAITGAAVSTARAIAYRYTGATGDGVATTSVGSYVRARRAASVASTAAGTVAARRYMSLSASGTAKADTTALLLRKVFRSATEAPTATAVARLAFKRGVPATTTATAPGSATTRIKQLTRGSTVAAASSSVAFRVSGLVFPSALAAQAVAASIHAQQQLNTNGGLTVASATGSAVPSAKFQVAASTVAQAVTSSGAEDFGLTINAPTERMMTVPASDRRMEVML